MLGISVRGVGGLEQEEVERLIGRKELGQKNPEERLWIKQDRT